MTHDLYSAIGQYLIYRAMLRNTMNTMPLYLAIPHHAYAHFDDAVMHIIYEAKINLIVIDLVLEEVVLWKPNLI